MSHRLDVKAEAKSQEPVAVAVAWRVRTPEGYCTRWFDGPPPKCYGPYELAYAHPTTKPEAPAVSVDAIVCPAKFAFGMNDPQATTFRYATNTCRSASSDLHRTPAHEWRQQKMSAFRNIVLICDCPSCMVLGLSCRTAGR